MVDAGEVAFALPGPGNPGLPLDGLSAMMLRQLKAPHSLVPGPVRRLGGQLAQIAGHVAAALEERE